MDSGSLRPFEYTRVGDFYYTFTSRDGIPYNIYFIPLQGIFETKTEKTPHHVSVGYALRSHLVSGCLKASFHTHPQANNSFCEALTHAEEKHKKPFRHWSLDLLFSEAQRNGVFPMVLAVLRDATGRCLGVSVESSLS